MRNNARCAPAAASLLVAVVVICFPYGTRNVALSAAPETQAAGGRQKADLGLLLRVLPADRTANGRVSFLDETFKDWLARTGELPPDFDRLPSFPFLPDPLVLDEGGKSIPVTTITQWSEKRAWMRKQLEYYVTGTSPPRPDNLQARIISEAKDGAVTVRTVELGFGPQHRARLTVELLIPPGKGPFPVFMTQWSHREWAHVAVRRGYVGCLYAGADSKDDTEEYSEIWSGAYDFNRLTRRAFGASRAIDYLVTLPFVAKDKIGLTGHSRNGDQSFIAAAFDERIAAVIPSSGTGMEVPWRYSAKKYDIEDISLLACAQPSWFQPRLRFFFGREHKLPVDQHFFMALIAPRGLMLSTALNEGAGNPWGSEQAYLTTRRVYRFLGAEDKLAIRFRQGLHGVCARDMEDYLDFFDYVFQRTARTAYKPPTSLVCGYSFEHWCQLSGEKVNPQDYPAASLDGLDVGSGNTSITSLPAWETKRAAIRRTLRWALGDEPPGVTNPGPGSLSMGGRGESSFGSFLVRPPATSRMHVMAFTPYSGFGDQLFGYLYYPVDSKGQPTSNRMPAVIYLHEYDYSKGFNSYHQVEALFQSIVDRGYAVFAHDMLGFGNRIEEGTRFYDRYPHWSKLGKMVVDVRAAVDALANMDVIDGARIFVAGYALGGTVGLYAAALDDRIAGVVSVAAFTPMRSAVAQRNTEGIRAFSHLHGLLPRLGFFVGHEAHVPYDYHEVLACIAPRSLLVIAPAMDKDAILEDVQACVAEARKIYDLYGAGGRLQAFFPQDFNRYSAEMREKTYQWLQERMRTGG